MRPNYRDLAMRDAASAVAFGIAEPSDFGAEFGTEFGVQFGADGPTPAQLQQLWAQQSRTSQRELVLEPNKDSSAKIQRYTFGVSQTLTLETASAFSNVGIQPETYIRPQRVTTNAPCPAFVTLGSIKVANVGVIVGGEIDAFDLAAQAQDAHLDVPTLSPANRVNVSGAYSGLLPSGGYKSATSYKFTVSFKGPASMVA